MTSSEFFRGQGFGLFVAAGHVGNGHRVFENFAPTGKQKKKVRLVDRVGCGNIEFWSRNAPRCGEVDLPKCLLDQPLFCSILRDLSGLGQFFNGGKAFPVARGL